MQSIAIDVLQQQGVGTHAPASSTSPSTSSSATTHATYGIVPQRVGIAPAAARRAHADERERPELTVEAALSGSREHVYHAAVLDPHTAAELPLEEIRELVDALLEAHGELVPALG